MPRKAKASLWLAFAFAPTWKCLIFKLIAPQIILQKFAGDVDAVFDSPNWNVKVLSNLMVLETSEMHHEGLAVLIFEICNRLIDVFDGKLSCGAIFRDAAGRIDVVKIFSRVNEGISPHHAVILRDEGILHDRIQPRLEVGAIGKLVAVGDGLEHGLLHQIVCVFSVACQLERKWPQKPVQALYLGIKLYCRHNNSVL